MVNVFFKGIWSRILEKSVLYTVFQKRTTSNCPLIRENVTNNTILYGTKECFISIQICLYVESPSPEHHVAILLLTSLPWETHDHNWMATLEAKVWGQVQAGHAGADLAQAAVRQHDQASPRGEAHLRNNNNKKPEDLTINLMIRAVIWSAFPSS